MAVKTAAFSNAALLQLLKTRLSKAQSVQQMYQSSVLETVAANPVPGYLTTDTIAAEKKRVASYFDAVLTSLARRPKAAVAPQSRTTFMMKGELYSPKHPGYAATHDAESTKGALASMLMRQRALNIAVLLEEIGDAFCQWLSDKAKSELIMHGFARFEARKPHVDYYQAVYVEARSQSRASRRVHAARL